MASARTRLRKFFLDNVGRVLDWEELRDASGGITEWARRVRELRQDEGYQILTHNDRADLRPGQYLLASRKPRPTFARNISNETRAFVLDRNGFTCQSCGAAAGEPHPNDPTRAVRLEMGHILDKSKGGTDAPSNLRAICSVCNQGLQNITLIRPDLKHVLVTIRRASVSDQLAALKWLKAKFGKARKR
jgi:HNH endonuclease